MGSRSDMGKVLRKLKKAGENMTEEQVREQKISFIMGTLSSKSTITRKEVEAHLDRMAGKRPAA